MEGKDLKIQASSLVKSTNSTALSNHRQNSPPHPLESSKRHLGGKDGLLESLEKQEGHWDFNLLATTEHFLPTKS